MKKIVILLIAASLIVCAQGQNQDKEKEAILKVLKEETDAFIANDMDRISAIHIQDSTEARVAQGPRNLTIYKGWDEVEALFANYFERNKANSSWQNPRNRKENVRMKITGNTAWLVCDNIWEYEVEKTTKKDVNLQVAFLEKVDGKWKFSYDSYIQKPSEGKNIELSNKYHERKLEDVDNLLAEDFVGSYYSENDTVPKLWYKENHKKAIARNPNIRDSILKQVAEGNWVATRFIRTGEDDGEGWKAEVMQFKQFKDGKIIRSWELFKTLK